MDEELEQLIKEAEEERQSFIAEENENIAEDKKENDTEEDSVNNERDSEVDQNVSQKDEREIEDTTNNNKEVEKDNFEKVTINVNGHNIEIDSKEELMSFVKKGAESFGKEDKKESAEQEIIEQGNLTREDLQLLIDAKNGDAKAIAKLAENAKVDLLEIDNNDAQEYTPKFQYQEKTEIDRVAQEILSKPDLATKFRQVSSSLPSSFIDKVAQNADDLRTFSNHVETGLAEKIIPEAIKLTYKGYDFTQAYVVASIELGKKAKKEMEEADVKKRNISEREEILRKQASDNYNNNSKKKEDMGDLSGDEIWNMTDEEFEKYTSGNK